MGFLRRRLTHGASWPPSGSITIWPRGDDFHGQLPILLMEPKDDGTVYVAGRSHYQDEIATLTDDRVAVLIPEPDNPHDRNAVRVVVIPLKPGEAWGKVGYLSRNDAVAYRLAIDRVAATGRVIGCRVIVDEAAGALILSASETGYSVHSELRVRLRLGKPEDLLSGLGDGG